jgi:hypothetical protein
MMMGDSVSLFQRVVEAEFSYLEADFGMVLQRLDTILVEWVAPSVAVRIYLDPKSREVGIEASRTGHENEDRFSLVEILGASDPRKADMYWPVPAGTDSEITERVAGVAALLRMHGHGLLTGDEEAFARLREARRAQSDQFLTETPAARGRRFARAAVASGDLSAAKWWLQRIPLGDLTAEDRALLVETGESLPR